MYFRVLYSILRTQKWLVAPGSSTKVPAVRIEISEVPANANKKSQLSSRTLDAYEIKLHKSEIVDDLSASMNLVVSMLS